MIAVGAAVAAPIAIANPVGALRVSGYVLGGKAIFEAILDPRPTTVFSAATAVGAFGASLSLKTLGATKTDMQIFDSIDGVKSIANEVLVPK